MEYCFVCSKRIATDKHHLINGNGNRHCADADKLTANLCRECHTWVHNNANAEHLCKKLGQMMYERELILIGDNESEARRKFISRYGRSYV